MALRDITDDLKARLAMIEAQAKAENVEYEAAAKALADKHDAAISELKGQWEAIQRGLQLEMRRLGRSADSPAPAANQQAPSVSLDDFMVSIVEKFGMAAKENFRNEAVHAGYFQPGETGGRQIHATLLNLVRAGRVRQIGPDTYAPANKPGEFLLERTAQ